MRKLQCLTLILIFALSSIIVMPLVKADSDPYANGMGFATVCFAGASGHSNYNGNIFTEFSALVSMPSKTPPQGVFLYNWIGGDSYDTVRKDSLFFQIVIGQYGGGQPFLMWYVTDELHTITVSEKSTMFTSLSPTQSYLLQMVFNGTGWALGCNGYQQIYFDWPYPAKGLSALTETWFPNGIAPDVGTTDFSQLQVQTPYGYVPFLALPKDYSVGLGSSIYDHDFPMYNGAIALSDSHIQTGFGYKNDTWELTTYQGSEPYSNMPYFNLQPLTVFQYPPTPTPFPLSTPTPTPDYPLRHDFPVDNLPLAIIQRNIVALLAVISGFVAVSLTALFKVKHRR